MEVQFSFYVIAAGVIKLFILMLLGYVIYRLKLIDDGFVDKLSLLLVRVIFPALIISKTIPYFSFAEYRYWWVLPVLGAMFSFSGMAISALAFKFLKGFRSKKEFMCAGAFQNCGYLPMTLIVFSFKGAVADRLLIYMFLFITGFNLLMWSIVPAFLSGELKKSFRPNVFLNPPVIATAFSLLWVAVLGKGSMPRLVMEPLSQLGQAAFPVALLTLGAYLCRYRAHDPVNKTPIIAAMLVKLLVFPLIVLILLFVLAVKSDYAFFLFLQAVMPTAVSLVMIGAYTGADNRFFSSIIFYTHLAAIFTIPLWMEIFHLVFGS